MTECLLELGFKVFPPIEPIARILEDRLVVPVVPDIIKDSPRFMLADFIDAYVIAVYLTVCPIGVDLTGRFGAFLEELGACVVRESQRVRVVHVILLRNPDASELNTIPPEVRHVAHRPPDAPSTLTVFKIRQCNGVRIRLKQVVKFPLRLDMVDVTIREASDRAHCAPFARILGAIVMIHPHEGDHIIVLTGGDTIG